ELPNVPEQYVHRIGRTARAGADGIAMSFVAPDEKAYLRDIEKLTRVKLDTLPLPADFAKEAARLPLPSRKQVQVAVEDGESRHKPHRRAEAGEGRRHPRGERPVREERRERPAREAHGDPRRQERRPDHRNEPRGYDPLGQLERDIRAGRGDARNEGRPQR